MCACLNHFLLLLFIQVILWDMFFVVVAVLVWVHLFMFASVFSFRSTFSRKNDLALKLGAA